MLISRLSECRQFLAGDHTILRELLHPAKAPASIGYSLAHGKLNAGARSKRHRLVSSEVYYFLAGNGRFAIGHETATVGPGTVIYVPAGAIQWLENTGTAVIEFLCIVDPAWTPEDEVILD
ncbi:MAG: cupin domain-containing protein [Nitrospiraceae bacterium]